MKLLDNNNQFDNVPLFAWARMPGVRLALVMLFEIAVLSPLVFSSFGFWFTAAVLLIAAIICLAYKWRGCAFIAATTILSCTILFRVQNTLPSTPDTYSISFPATVSGIVENVVRRDENILKIIVSGVVDGKYLQPIHSRVLTTIYQPKTRNNAIIPGAQVVVVGELSAPQKKVFEGTFDESRYCRGLDVQWTMAAFESNIAAIGQNTGFALWLNTTTESVLHNINAIFSPNYAPFCRALILGDKSTLPRDVKQSYSLAGTAHILAVSGLHIGVVAAVIALPLGFIENRRCKFMVFAAALWLFIALSGFQPSAVRAGTMATIAMFSYTYQRKIVLLNIVAVAGVVLILIEPTLLFSVGFQLSMASLFGIALLAPILTVQLRRLLPGSSAASNFIRTSLLLTLSASATVAPIVAYYFEVFSYISPIANIVVVPAMSLGLVFSVVSVALSYIHLGFAEFFAGSAQLWIYIANVSSDFFSSLPFSSTATALTARFSSVVFSVGFIYCVLSNSVRHFFFRFLSIAVFSVLVWNMISKETSEDNIKIIPRKHIVMAEIPLNDSVVFIALCDRVAGQKPKNDYLISEYLATSKRKIIIGKRGNNSEWISVLAIQRNQNLSVFPMSDAVMQNVEQKYLGDRKLFRVMKYQELSLNDRK